MSAGDVASSAEIEEFLHCGLVSWLELYLPKCELISGYSSLLDGMLINCVWQKVDPDPLHSISPLIGTTGTELATARTKNFESIVQNIRDFYENELDQVILTLPDCLSIGCKPDSKSGLEHLKLLVILVLGAAVQSSQKALFIEKIKELDVSTQHEIVEMIKRVTDETSLVLSKDHFFLLQGDALYKHIKVLNNERNLYYSKWISTITDIEKIGSKVSKSASSASSIAVGKNCEIIMLKSTVRELKQELAEKSDVILELAAEMDLQMKQAEKLQAEKQELHAEAKRAIAYRDELDIAYEKIARVHHLEAEVAKLRKKLSNAELYKTRVDQLLEDNRLLIEAKNILEGQLERDRLRSEQLAALESQVNEYKGKLNEIVRERSAEQAKFDELVIENTQLHFDRRSSSMNLDVNASGCESSTEHGDVSLSDELRNSVQAKLLALELENSRLITQIEEVRELSAAESVVAELVDVQKKYSQQLERGKELNLAAEQNKKLLEVLQFQQKTMEQQSEEIRVVNDKRDTLKSYVIKVHRKLKQLSQQNKAQAEKISQLKLNLEKLTDADRKVHELQEQIEKLASQQVTNETHIQNMTKELDVQTKINSAIKNKLEKLGFNSTMFEDGDVEVLLKSGEVFSKPEGREKFLKIVGASSGDLVSSSSKNNFLVAKVSTLESKLNSLQQVNDQLASNKDKLLKQIESLKQGHKLWTRGQTRWERQTERLNVTLNKALKDHDILKNMVHEFGDQDLKSWLERLEKENPLELETLKADHAKLSEDFSALYETCNQYKNDYETLKVEYDSIQVENERLKEQIIELSEKIQSIVNAEDDYKSLADRCEMLMAMNTNLTRERQALMDNISKLFTQYSELLSHSLEDKQHYHDARECYLHQVSEMELRKERLEMKILEQYKSIDNSGKKKDNSLIKRVKKVSSDLFSKVPTRGRKSLPASSTSTPSTPTQNESGSMSIVSEPNSESVQDIYFEPRTQSWEGDFVDPVEREVEDNRRNSCFASFESPSEPTSSLDCLQPGCRKPIYVLEDKRKK